MPKILKLIRSLDAFWVLACGDDRGGLRLYDLGSAPTVHTGLYSALKRG
jgi:hypothetical protein